MNPQQALTVREGDPLRPHPLWNATEPKRKLASPTQVLEVLQCRGCQSGVMFKVRFLNGSQTYLDAGWFEPPAQVQPSLF